MNTLEELRIKELKIRDEVDYKLDIYHVGDLETIDEVNDALTAVADTGQTFRYVHVELKSFLGDKYAIEYPDSVKISESLRDFEKKSRKRIRVLKTNVNELDAKSEHNTSVEENKLKLQIVMNTLLAKMDHLNKTVDIDLINVQAVNEYITKMEKLTADFLGTIEKFKSVCGDEFDPECWSVYVNVPLDASQDVKMAKLLRKKLVEVTESKKKKKSKKEFQQSALVKAKNLFIEIELRFESLMSKFKVDLTSLSDYQILEIAQNKNIDLEFNDVLEKVTGLAALVPEGGKVASNLLSKACALRESAVSDKKQFLRNLNHLITDRDITPEKLKHAAEVIINLPKFSGYDSKMDLFTFKSQYKKHVEPKILKKCWADYLKMNYLDGPALNLVEKETDYARIWEKLMATYGNPRLLLQNKMSDLDIAGGLWKIRGEDKLFDAIASLVNKMKDLSQLAAEHKIEGQLYEGGGLEKVLSLIGDRRHVKFREQNLDTCGDKKVEWIKILKFLERELKVKEKLILDHKSAQMMGLQRAKKDPPGKSMDESKLTPKYSANVASNGDMKCHICDETGHTFITTAKGRNIIPYYVCKKFNGMSPADRHSILNSKKLCTGCLYPGAVRGPGHKCFFIKFCCPDASHTEKVHVLVCEKHKSDNKNVEILKKFKEKFIENCTVELPSHAKSLSCFSEMVNVIETKSVSFERLPCEPEVTDNAIFLLQPIDVQGIKLNIFFDNGCGDMVITKSAVDKLSSIGWAKQVIPGPLELTGVGENIVTSEDGLYSVCLPLRNGNNAKLTGICLPKITSKFPIYDLGVVEGYIRDRCKEIGGPELVEKLPLLAREVGGDTHILLGSKYKKYFPKLIFELDTGLGIYDSVFESIGGTTGVVNGPHKQFTEIDKKYKGHQTVYFEKPVLCCRSISGLGNSVPLLGYRYETPNMFGIDPPLCCSILKDEILEDEVECICDQRALVGRRPPRCVKQFDEIDTAGTEVMYRCVDCRTCPKCKTSMRFDSVSIQEELEQGLIERSVEVDTINCRTVAKLPFLVDPETRLVPNEGGALRVLWKQIKNLNLKPEDKKMVIEFEKKLQDMGFVDYLSNLDEKVRSEILCSIVKYFIPWRAVWNENSVTTPCRMVFDASMGSRCSCSLNSLVAKGTNSLNKLVEILIRWQVHPFAFHTDVTKMYNRIMLDEAHWKYQLYLWVDGLNENVEPVWKVIKTMIYGVRSSGNIAECALRRTAESSKEEFPRACDVILFDTYMDDCISGESSRDRMHSVSDNMIVSLARGGFTLKGFTFSGENPAEHLSKDGESIHVGGLIWFPKGDFIKLNIKKLSFARRQRGRIVDDDCSKTVEITKRICAKVVYEIYDPVGKVAPIVAGMKLDISVLHQSNLGWDDPIPGELKNIWLANFDLIDEISTLQFKRAVVPENACSLEIETIDTADAGENLVCAAVYARFKLRDGSYSCQLIFARTKIVHDLSIPRAELAAALLNASTGHVVRLSLKDYHKKCWKLTDSQVTLHWINSVRTALKMWVRHRVVEIIRLSEVVDWWYVSSKNMVADIGTRKGAKIDDVKPGSPWIDGHEWMSRHPDDFPVKSVSEIVLFDNDKTDFEKERIHANFNIHFADARECYIKYVPNELNDRYKFASYLVDPNRFRYQTVLRILGLVLLFLSKTSRGRSFEFMRARSFTTHEKEVYVVQPSKSTQPSKVRIVPLPGRYLDAAKTYFFMKATREIQRFVDARKYKDISILHDGILYYTSRILSTQEIDGKIALGDICLDLSASTFCVPIVDALSPIAYAMVAETHWHHPDVSHAGVESVLRLSQTTAYILGGRELVKSISKACAKCRILHKKKVRVAMGPLGDSNFCIAPAFYYCQVDLCGPLKAYSPANKRATLKVWYVVFCCTTTGAVDCRIMEDYSADSFLLAFERFACRFGYPKIILPDEGSQLVKGCEDMVISFSDVQQKMSREYGVDFKTCPVGAHNVHGKVERKIREIRRSLEKSLEHKRLSVLQWETLGQQIANTINNTPIGLGNKSEMIESLDILTPNRLILGRNNNRSPSEPLQLTNDVRKILESNNNIYETWFREWLMCFVPTVVGKPKWFVTERHVNVGDVVLFLKSDKEFDRQYQYGLVVTTLASRDGLIRTVVVEYQNAGENIKRQTKRSVRDLVIIHPVDELGIYKELHDFATKQ